jgi:hypothetical protein
MEVVCYFLFCFTVTLYLSVAHDLHRSQLDVNVFYYVLEEIERSVSSSTNTSADQNQRPMETEEYPQQEEEEERHHGHRTRSSSFDIAQALVNANNNIMDQETNTTNSSFSNPPADFADASLLLGLTDTAALPSKPVRGELEPATLPSTMTFFLDMLNEDQRRVRHRHIPAVDGFRKLYKSEIKQDLAAARALNKKSKRGDESMMEVDEEMKDELSENDGLAEFASAKAEAFEDALPDSDAFVAPSENTIAFAHCGQLASLMESTPFENSMRGGVSASTLRSPQLVESLTAFNPPRPQESTATKTKHRLKRWESNPQDVEVDLLNYKKTVQRTRMELHKAEDEHAQIESVTSMMRTQYMNHLDAYREEIAAVGEQLRAVRSDCLKAAEEHNGKTISTRGSSKTMRDVFAALKTLGDDLGAKATGSGDSTKLLHPDWRVSGLGGIAAAEEGARNNDSLASGWILVGDKVKTLTGECGTVMEIIAPSIKTVAPKENKKDPTENDIDKTKTDADAPLVKTEEPSLSEMVVPEGIAVRLANGTVKTFPSSDLKLETAPFPCAKDADLVRRWENMKQSAIDTGSRHDYSGMNAQVISSVLRKQQEDDQDGSASPKSVTQYDDLRNVVPFGAGIISAPEQIRDFSSIIPVDALEENVRKVIYGCGKDIQVSTCLCLISSQIKTKSNYLVCSNLGQVIPAMPPSVEKYESQRENLNKLKIKVLQLRNRLGRQKRIRGLNELNFKAGEKRADKVEGLLIEMQTDLASLKGRLQEELDELGELRNAFCNILLL